MRRFTIILTTALAFVASPLWAAPAATMRGLPGRTPGFTANRGQWDARVLYKAEGAGGLTYWIERDGFTLLQTIPDCSAEPIPDPNYEGLPEELRPPEPPRYPTKSHALKFRFQNALPRTAGNFLPEQTTPAVAASVEPTERLSWNNNYFLGSDPAKWAPDCGNFQRVVLIDVWEGVDVVWRGGGEQQIKGIEQIGQGLESAKSAQSAVEFDFLIHPGADASQIRLECLGLTGDIAATADGGELLLPTSLGILRQALPEAFQIAPDGSLAPVRAEFKVESGNSFGVALLEGWDRGKKLVIDPLVYSTYLGGRSADYATALLLDGAEGVVVAGATACDDFPTTEGAFDRSFGAGGFDAFVTKFNEDGDELLYSTYLGGREIDWANALSSDGAEGLIIAGRTGSNNFPTTDGAFDRSFNGANSDAFVTRLNGEGNELLYSTYLGGRNEDYAKALTPDGVRGVVVAGETWSNNFPTTEDAFDQSFNGGHEAFVTRLSEDGNELLYSTYLGGSHDESAAALISDGEGGVIVAGLTTSDDFPTTEGVIDRLLTDIYGDAFIARLNGDGSELLFSTFLGENGWDEAYALASDGAGGVVVAGRTIAGAFPTTEGAFDRVSNGENDAFVARLSGDGSELLFSTYLGGRGNDYAYALIPDGSGGVVVAGRTYSDNFPTTERALDRSFDGERDAFVARLSGDGRDLRYSTYLGGGSHDEAFALELDEAGGVVIAGNTYSNDFPTTEGAFDRSLNGSFDAFVTRIDIGISFLRWVEIPDTIEVEESQVTEFDVQGESSNEEADLSIAYHSDDLPEAVTFEDHGDGSGTFSWQTAYGDAGNYTATFTLSDGEHEISAEVPIEVKELFHIALRQGWNLLSSVVPPGDPAQPAVWAEIVQRGNLFMVKDHLGWFYMPERDFNNMGDWDMRYGYYAKLNDADTLVIPGDPVAADTPIRLDRVWSIVAYFPREPLPAPVAFANIVDDLLLAKDESGRFYIPEHDFSNMGNLSRGEGYQVKVSGAVELVWNMPEGLRIAQGQGVDLEPVYFGAVSATDRSMSLLTSIVGLSSSSSARQVAGEAIEVAAFTGAGLCVGAGSCAPSQPFREGGEVIVGLAVWGDDPTTPEIDGAQEGEVLTFKVWDGEKEFAVEPVWREGDGGYAADGFALATVAVDVAPRAVTPGELTLDPPHPNPFNASTRIRFAVPFAVEVNVEVIDLAGRRVATLVSGVMPAGYHHAAWNPTNLASGLYLVRMNAANFVQTQRVILVR